jgi:hypothetical protein
MTIKVELNPETEALLVAKARSQGVPLEKLAAQLLNEAVTVGGESIHEETRGQLSVEEFHHMLKGIAEGSDRLPNLSTESFSRESFYEERVDGPEAPPRR